MLACLISGAAQAGMVAGFTQPWKTIAVAAPVSGVLAEVPVDEGQRVIRGQVLARLDNRTKNAELAVARARMAASANLEAARARQIRADRRRQQLESLLARGNAQQSEVDEARAAAAIAAAEVKRALEEQTVARLNVARIEAEIARRTLASPIDGVVVALRKEVGELLSSGEQTVMILAQLDPLLIIVHAPLTVSDRLTRGEQVEVTLSSDPEPLVGTVELVAPVVNPESATVKVKVRLDNPQGRYRSGVRAHVQVTSEPGSGNPE